MPYRRRFSRGGFRRVRRNWQWARFTSNNTAVIGAPGHYTYDLLSTFKTEYGFSVNFPDITIWRVRLKISVAIHWTNPVTQIESNGVLVGLFVDDPNFTIQGVETHPYMEKFMWYEMVYYSEAIMAGAREPANGTTDFFSKQFDVKACRRLGNVEDSLILQLGTSGPGVLQFDSSSISGSVLLSMGRR